MSTPAAVPAQDLRTAVEAATLAPSLHNSQPWWFHIGAGVIDVHADPSRNPTVIDPQGREMHLGCGAATCFAVVALRGMGWAVRTTLLPEHADPELVARVEVTGPEPVTEPERLLVDMLPIRYTDRGRYEERPVPPELVGEFRSIVAQENAWLRPLDRPEDQVTVAVLLAHADDIERADPAYVAELESWSRFDREAPDGVPREAVDPTPVEARPSSYRLRDFDVDDSVAAGYVMPEGMPTAEHPLVVVLGTPQDDRRSWLEAGMALGRLLLRAAVDGVSAAPMTQVLEVPSARLRLGHDLGSVGHPQMLLRMGYGTGRPTTHRRPVDEVLR